MEFALVYNIRYTAKKILGSDILQEKISVVQSQYVLSAVNKSQYPAETLPEIAFIGRSNVGKSSLINSLTQRKSLAKTSGTPGKTQTINFFSVRLKLSAEENIFYQNFYLVDLPGYGYAKAGKKIRQVWLDFVEEFLLASKNIKFICQLVDIRHPPQESDKKFFRWLIEKKLPVLIVATKADKISKSELKKNLSVIKKTFGVEEISPLPYSAKNNFGREFLLEVIADSLTE